MRGREDFIIFGSPALTQEDKDEVLATLDSGWLGTGPRTMRFEKEFREYTGAGHALALNSCTAALHLSVLAEGLSPGDEVITTPLTFCATVNSIIHAGGTPVLADVDPATGNISPVEIERKVTPRTKGLVVVHYAGRPCEMDRIVPIVDNHGLFLVEDCAHAIETEYHGTKAGNFGQFGCFSFYVTKNVVTGEGGMLVTGDTEKAEWARVMALHGMSKDAYKRFSVDKFKHYQVIQPGFKYNMMDIQAALGIHQLARVEENWKRREEIWNRYNLELADLPLVLPAPDEPDTRHARHLYTLLVDEEHSGLSRDWVVEALTAEGIGVGVHYISINEHPYYTETFGWRPDHYPHATHIGRTTISIPISPILTDNDVKDIVLSIRKVFGA